MVVQLADNQFTAETALCFGAKPSARAYGSVQNAGMDIICYTGIGPLTAWVDDHLFVRIPRIHLDEYNAHRRHWHTNIMSRGEHQAGGRIWYSGQVFEDGTLEEFDEDCTFSLQDLSQSSPHSEHDSNFAYNFDDIDAISQELGIPWE